MRSQALVVGGLGVFEDCKSEVLFFGYCGLGFSLGLRVEVLGCQDLAGSCEVESLIDRASC